MRVEWPTPPIRTPEEFKEVLRAEQKKILAWLRVAESAHQNAAKSTLHFGPGPRPE